MQVSIHVAKTQLSKLIETALSGEEVVIAKGGKPVVRLVAIPRDTFKIGLLRGQLEGPGPDFFEPLEEGGLKRWEGGG